MRTFSSKLLSELDLPDAAIEDKIIGKRRWSLTREIVFEFEGNYYQTTYSEGSTELQDEGPWECQKEVECYPVKQVEKVVKVWERIE